MTTATLKASVAIGESGSNAFSSGPFWNGSLSYSQVLSNGTTANKADLSYVAEITVATAANSDLDLAGVLTDALGNTVTAAEIVAIMVKNVALDGTANTTDLTIGGGSNPVVGFMGGTTPTIGPIKPGGMVMLAAGDAAGLGAVTAGTGDILRIANSSGATAKFQIAILARSA